MAAGSLAFPHPLINMQMTYLTWKLPNWYSYHLGWYADYQIGIHTSLIRKSHNSFSYGLHWNAIDLIIMQITLVLMAWRQTVLFWPPSWIAAIFKYDRNGKFFNFSNFLTLNSVFLQYGHRGALCKHNLHFYTISTVFKI